MRFDRLTVLLVDDNAHMRVLLSEILRATGVKTLVEASDRETALELMRDYPVDVVITDLAMAPMDGLEFVRRLRNSPASPNAMVPVIMVTGHSTVRRVAQARDVGVTEFLSKPVTARGVIERIVRIVDHPRLFVRAGEYFGPDRRRREDPGHRGPYRRQSDA